MKRKQSAQKSTPDSNQLLQAASNQPSADVKERKTLTIKRPAATLK
jgi:hypothetical protein